MINFKDFELLQEKENYQIPQRVQALIDKFTTIYGEIKRDPWPEVIKKEGYPYQLIGLRLYLKNRLFRVSWKEEQGEPIIIDVWDWQEDSNLPGLSLIGNYPIFNYHSKKILDFLSSSLFPSQRMESVKVLEQLEEENAKIRIIPSPPEETEDTLEPSVNVKSDAITVFDDLRTLVTMVIEDINPSLIIAGRGGIGKTRTVMKTIKDFGLVKDQDYVVIKGASTALSLYKSLYINRDKILIYDDCDSILKDADGINILKAALDSYDEREISWLSRSTYNPDTDEPSKSREVPSRFMFEGQIIFITNRRIDEIDEAVKSRSYVVDISLTEEDIIEIMEKSLPEVQPNVPMKTKQEVLNYLKESSRKSDEAINMRTLIKAIKIRLSGASNWRELISKYA